MRMWAAACYVPSTSADQYAATGSLAGSASKGRSRRSCSEPRQLCSERPRISGRLDPPAFNRLRKRRMPDHGHRRATWCVYIANSQRQESEMNRKLMVFAIRSRTAGRLRNQRGPTRRRRRPKPKSQGTKAKTQTQTKAETKVATQTQVQTKASRTRSESRTRPL